MNALQTFHAHGHEWTPHTPGDPMPCAPDARVHILLREDQSCLCDEDSSIAGTLSWRAIPRCPWAEIIGWRYAAPPLQPEQEPSELDRVKSENERMRTALQKIAALRDGNDRLFEGGCQKIAIAAINAEESK